MLLQLVDDHLDFVGSAASLGKPALSDMDQGLATAPVLFALEEFPQIGDIVKRSPSATQPGALTSALSPFPRAGPPLPTPNPSHAHRCPRPPLPRRFGDESDAALVGELVSQSDGLRRTQELATAHARKAAEALGVLAPSSARDALLRLCFDVLNRQA